MRAKPGEVWLADQGLGSLPPKRVERHLGKIPPELFAKVKEALRFALDL